jgi:hypothetical protein
MENRYITFSWYKIGQRRKLLLRMGYLYRLNKTRIKETMKS